MQLHASKVVVAAKHQTTATWCNCYYLMHSVEQSWPWSVPTASS